jgi:hypothetical protein
MYMVYCSEFMFQVLSYMYMVPESSCVTTGGGGQLAQQQSECGSVTVLVWQG